MISINDTTILALIDRFPDMSDDEAERYIARLEHAENADVCRAIRGKVPIESLSVDARYVVEEILSWSKGQTRLVAEGEMDARRKGEVTSFARHMRRLCEKGLVTHDTLVRYGIEGPLPERVVVIPLTQEEKDQLKRDRVEKIHQLWEIMTRTVKKIDWEREGF